MRSLFLNTFIKFFFLLTPFFVLSTFLAMTQDFDQERRRGLARRVTVAIVITCLTLFVAGNYLFDVLGITLDAFRVGAGVLLFLAAISLVHGKRAADAMDPNSDIAVVPLAIPIAVGPASTGALLVMGGELETVREKMVVGSALLLAVLIVGGMLYLSARIEQLIGQKGLNVLSKLTGLILSAMSAQLVLQGVKNFRLLG